MLAKDKNPWLGLASYEYKDAYRFFGRAKELVSLKEAICHNAVTTIYGISGAGKTSLINAGVSPLLEQESFLPVRIRLDHSGGMPYSEQIIRAIETTIGESGGEIERQRLLGAAEAIPESERLWLFFHSSRLWSASNHPVCPVIFIDQFEELFTQNSSSELIASFFSGINALQYAIPPEHVAQQLSAEEGYVDLREGSDYRLVLVLREDFLARLEDYAYDIPALRKNRVGIKRMNGLQALDVILRPMPEIITREEALRIIAKVAGAEAKENASYLEHMSIDTSLLSLFCSELYEKAAEQQQDRITSELIDQFGADILSAFYDETMRLVSVSTAEYLETHLLTLSGYRNAVALEDMVANGILQSELEELSRKRLIRIETSNGTERVEYTHDVLCGIAKEHRDRRQQQEAKKANIFQGTMALFGALISFGFFSVYLWNFNKYSYSLDDYSRISQVFERLGITTYAELLAPIAFVLLLLYAVAILPLYHAKDRNAMPFYLAASIVNFLCVWLISVLWYVPYGALLFGMIWFALVPFVLFVGCARYHKRKRFKEYIRSVIGLDVYASQSSLVLLGRLLSYAVPITLAMLVGLLLHPIVSLISIPLLGWLCYKLLPDKSVSLRLLLPVWVIMGLCPLIPYGGYVFPAMMMLMLGWLLGGVLRHPDRMRKRMPTWLMTCVFIPLLCIGYNIFLFPEYARVPEQALCMHDNSRMLKIRDWSGQQGLRDRHDMVIPVAYDAIKPQGDRWTFHVLKEGMRETWRCDEHLEMENLYSRRLTAYYNSELQPANIDHIPAYVRYRYAHPEVEAKIAVDLLILRQVTDAVKAPYIDKLRSRRADYEYDEKEWEEWNAKIRHMYFIQLPEFLELSAQDPSMLSYASALRVLDEQRELLVADTSGYARYLLLETVYPTLRRQTDAATYETNLSYWLLYGRDAAGAEKAARAAIAADASREMAYRNLFLALWLQERYEEALTLLEQHSGADVCAQPQMFKSFEDAVWDELAGLTKAGIYTDTESEAYKQLQVRLAASAALPPYTHAYRDGEMERHVLLHADTTVYEYIVDASGAAVTPCFEAPYIHTDGEDTILVYRDYNTLLYGYYIFSGAKRYTLPTQYEKAWAFSEGKAVVQHKGRLRVIDKNGKQLFKMRRQDRITQAAKDYPNDYGRMQFNNGWLVCMRWYQYGVRDEQGKWLLRPKYYDISFYGGKIYITTSNYRRYIFTPAEFEQALEKGELK